jgi:uncharacterized membrane protein YphA (DoxX/SURF4 family)
MMKFLDMQGSVHVFESLGMEPHGRMIIASLELLASLLLISPFAAAGALLALGVMCGAALAHVSSIGIVVNDDTGMLFLLMLIVLVGSSYVLIKRRRELPLVGKTL